jgi:hypothetical protein
MTNANARRRRTSLSKLIAVMTATAILSIVGCMNLPKDVETNPAVEAGRFDFDARISAHNSKLMSDGRAIFRYDTFGSEAFWGERLKLHQAIAGEREGGVGPGLTARQALELGLKVDTAKLPQILAEVLRGGSVSLDKTETTMELLRADAVVGVKASFDADRKRITSIGITCAFCHSTVDDSLARGIGKRLDGWPNRDLDVGAIVALAPDLSPFQELMGVDRAGVVHVLKSWGPGKYDAELDKDGKGFRPDGKSAATMIPAAYGLSGVNLHTYTGWGTVTYWNAYVANTQMHGQGTFFDPRLRDSAKFPLAARSGSANLRHNPDLITSKLAALHFYQLSIPAPEAPAGSYDPSAAERGRALFTGKARCSSCHVPPLFTEPGWSMHTPAEIGIDDFQARRSPDGMYRTTPRRGLFVRAKGGFYHDGRFPTYGDVVAHYNSHLRLGLSETETRDLIEFLKQL